MFLDAFFRSDPNAEPGNPENPATPLTGENIATTSGMISDVFVSPETAMKLAAVYSCIYVLSSNWHKCRYTFCGARENRSAGNRTPGFLSRS